MPPGTCLRVRELAAILDGTTDPPAVVGFAPTAYPRPGPVRIP